MNMRLIGGEMLVWSDLDGTHGSGPVRGAVLAPLLATATGRTLVAGPHDPALIDALDVTDLTLLVRGVPDAEALAARYADRPGMTVCCGSPEKLAADPPYDTVIALDGVARLSSVEGADLTWAELFEILVGVLRPGGTLMMSVENFLGVHRLVALPPAITDSDWTPSGAYDPTRPAGLARARHRLNTAGLSVTRAYAAYPEQTEPAALFSTEILGDEEIRGFLEATIGPVCTPLGHVLTDPAGLAVNAIRHGAAADLAPAWIFVARSGNGSPAGVAPPADAIQTAAGGKTRATRGRKRTSATTAAMTDGDDLVATIGDSGAQAAVELPAAVLATGTIRRRAAGGWVRDGAGDAVPAGRTLEDLLIAAALRRDLPTMRELLGAWQTGDDAGVPADQVIIGDDGARSALAATGEPAAALRAFAETLVRGGFAHPWPPTADAAELAVTLGILAGREVDPAAQGQSATRSPDAGSYRELVGERDRLAQELAEAKAKAVWYEQMLTSRDNALTRAQRIVELLSASGPARAGKALMGGAKAARRTTRVVMRRIRPRT